MQTSLSASQADACSGNSTNTTVYIDKSATMFCLVMRITDTETELDYKS